jgi:hypothetical protein
MTAHLVMGLGVLAALGLAGVVYLVQRRPFRNDRTSEDHRRADE